MSDLYKLNYVESEFMSHTNKTGAGIHIQVVDYDGVYDNLELDVFVWTQVSELKNLIFDLNGLSRPLINTLQLFYKNLELNVD